MQWISHTWTALFRFSLFETNVTANSSLSSTLQLYYLSFPSTRITNLCHHGHQPLMVPDFNNSALEELRTNTQKSEHCWLDGTGTDEFVTFGHDNFILVRSWSWGEAQCLGVLVFLADDSGSVPSTCTQQSIPPSLKDPTLSSLLTSPGTRHTHNACTKTLTKHSHT